MSSSEPTCPVCLGPLPAIGAACPACEPDEQTPIADAYVAFQDTEPCRRCGEGESWTVKGPDGACIGQSWTGEGAQVNAEETAQMLNAAFELGRKSAAAAP